MADDETNIISLQLNVNIIVPRFPTAWHAKEAPPRDWMVEDCFVRGTVGLLSGDGGIGKSLLMQQLASITAIGRGDWLGLKVQPGRSLMLACEDDEDELHRRQENINRHIGCDMDEIAEAGLVIQPRVGEDNTLMRLDRANWKMVPTKYLFELQGFAKRHGIQYLIIDTATQTFSGNQNDERHVMEFINALRKIAIAINGIVILTKHPSMSGRAANGESGSVAWNNSVRSRFYMHKDKEGRLLFECKKSNYGKLVSKYIRWERGVYVVDEETRWMPYND